MNVASLENSKKLYELSGWEDTYFAHATVIDKTWKGGGLVRPRQGSNSAWHEDPAYSAGYLLRKLPKKIKHSITGERVELTLSAVGEKWQVDYEWTTQPMATAATPEDALALLAIKLIEEGIITP